MSMELLNAMNGRPCACGKKHSFDTKIHIGAGVLKEIPGILASLNCKKPFLLFDPNTYEAAGKALCGYLDAYSSYCFEEMQPEPDEKSVGSAVMHFDASCDCIIGVGSGVINDIGKILSKLTCNPYIIIATAPSMDGYASATSSMTRDGLKISLPSRSADVIVGDTDILCAAPLKMMKSGLGDMLAKYVSICEWRISALITGEYYCEEVAALIRGAVKRCRDHSDGLLRREPAAVQAVFEGLVIGGVAMNYAGLSRPASGVEHYISHVLDMRGVEFGIPVESHGLQCAVGTLIAAKMYEKVLNLKPSEEKSLEYAAHFDVDAWHNTLRAFLGKGAESMIALEKIERKYDVKLHKVRLDVILTHWDEILSIIRQELPSSVDLEALLDRLNTPKNLADLGADEALLPTVFRATKDIRDKYVLSRLLWDLGELDEFV